MALKKTVTKLNEYFDRLKAKEAKRIKVKHVEMVIAKLEVKKAELDNKIDNTKKPERKDRLKRKRKVVREQIARAEYLRREIQKSHKS